MNNSERIKVPTNSIGLIKGKKGANLNDIQRRSNAKCKIKENYIIVTGSNDARRIAINLIKDCVYNSIIVYGHPIEAIIALRPPLVGLKNVLFVKYKGNVDMNNVNKAFFVLDEEEKKRHEQLDNLTLRMINLNIEKISRIIAPEKDETLIDHITERLIELVLNNKTHVFRLKANIGKQLFYPATKDKLLLPSSVQLARLLKYEIGYQRDVKVVFMNYISFDIAKEIESRLGKLGYKEDNEKIVQRASIHLIDVNAEKRFTISTDITSEGKLRLRKYSVDNMKHLFLSFTRSKSDLDFRFRILSREPPITNVPLKLKNLINKATYDFNTMTFNLTDTTDYLFTVIRVKVKRRFFKSKGELSNNGLKVIISEIQEMGKKDVQVSVTSDALQENLEKIKKDSCNKEVGKFVNEMYRIVDGLHYNVTG
ncbi:6678_t:CDS:2 [Funneliformis geosporum]|uniref:8518_t:CDS:1 n=1 Tax=Funneliformis geosporum TaxID=1117311 RepID=A0A9W4SBE9_9GLOM|nr:6678_t:CDS:2 [Funneliformis geosporum]CAI2162453.1 8518_t:CDS:2 [Funneliformis geosporum]